MRDILQFAYLQVETLCACNMVYEKIKNIARKLVPKSVLIGQEELLRKLIFLFYKGKRHECTVCNKKLRSFIQLEVGDKLCPYCGSSSRQRRLWTLLQPRLNNNISVLDFSPPRCLYRKLLQLRQVAYTPTDFAGEFLASRSLDITHLDLEDNSYDLIVCYHVLEHVEEDRLAMTEMFRVLKPSGSCIIQTPFKDGDIYEDASIKDPKERKKHFDQEDHVRIYSVDGLSQRLILAGFTVERMRFAEEENNYHGFRMNENVLIARK